MMRTPPLRALIVVSWMCLISGALISAWQPWALSPAAESAIVGLDAEFAAWTDSLTQAQAVALYVGVGALALLEIVGSVGLFLYRRWGRTLSIATTLVAYALAPWFGAELVGPIDGLLLGLATLTWGAALAIACWSDAAARFAANGDVGATAVDITVLAPP